MEIAKKIAIVRVPGTSNHRKVQKFIEEQFDNSWIVINNFIKK